MPRINTSLPPQAIKFLKHFPGNHILITMSQTQILAPYYNPGMDMMGLIKQSNEKGHHVFFTVNETKKGTSRKAEDIVRCRAIFMDDDTPIDKPRIDWPIIPSIVVKSSTVEGGNKYHYYWLTSTEKFDEWSRVEAGLVDKYEADPQCKDLSRILRVPGYVNTKNGSLCEIEYCNSQFYDWKYILQHFPPITKSRLKEIEPVKSGEIFNEHKCFKEFFDGNPGDITKNLNGYIAHLAHRHSIDAITTKVDQLYKAIPEESLESNSDRYYAAREQVPKFVKSIKAKLAKDRAIVTQSPVVRLHPDIPESLEHDWSVLKSNPIPENSVPITMLSAAKEIGEWTGVGQDPAILSAVFITSALLSKNIIIHEIGEDLTTHCQSGICIVMVTGARKSAIYEQMNKPFFDFEDRLQEEWLKKSFMIESHVKAIDSDISKLDKLYDKAKDVSDTERNVYIESRGKKLEEKNKLQVKKPWLRSSDLTEEKLIRKLEDNQECIAVISDDARAFVNNILTPYKEGKTGEGVYINALTGSSILYERVGSDKEIDIKRPVLNALLFIQPDSALKLRNADMFVPSGLAARLPMYFYPVSGEDIVANTSRRKVNVNKMQSYYTALNNICVRRFDNPLHIRLDEAGMNECAKMDKEFVENLKGIWRGHYDKSNKIVTLALMYSTCFAALEDPQFSLDFNKVDVKNIGYILPVKYIKMGFEFAKSLFGQSITSYQSLTLEALPRKAESVLSTLKGWYSKGKINEGFTQCAHFNNAFGLKMREFIPDIIDMLFEKKWLYTTIMSDDKRKLNGGFPDKYVSPGDIIYHLNIEGIHKREDMNLEAVEKGLVDK